MLDAAELREGSSVDFPSESRKLDVRDEIFPLNSLRLSFSFAPVWSELVCEGEDGLSTKERWLSPRRLNLSLEEIFEEDKFLGRPSLKEPDLGLRLPI